MISKIEGFIESRDVKLHYIANKFKDINNPSLLFVPGIMMPAWIWENQLEYFSKNYNVVAMEPRSQGDSSHSCEGHYAFSMAKDIQAVVQALDLKSVVLIGWSIGVPQVINYAAHFKLKNLVGLVLIDGIVGTDPSLSFYQSMVDYWTEFQMDRISNTEKFIKSLFKQDQKESFFKKLNAIALRTPTNTVMTLINNYILQDFRALLPHIDTPTFIATIDGPRLGYMQDMHRLLPNSHMEVFQSAGHALFVDQAERFNRSMETFIENQIPPHF
jgi:microsomal epoxide hydrolase